MKNILTICVHAFATCRLSRVGAALVLMGVLCGVFAPVAQAATGVPRILNYQGRLTSASGSLLGGTGTEYCFKFSLYDSPTVGNGSKLWPAGAPSSMTSVVKNGVFSVGIGDTNAGGDVLDFNFQDTDAAYINVEVANKVGATCAAGDGAESFENLSPRQRIFASGYALNSNMLNGYSAAQFAVGSQIPVLSMGNLVLGGVDPIISASTTNKLTLQGSSTGDLLFFNSSNKITAAGDASFAGSLTAAAANVTNASTTNFSSSYASSTQGFFGSLSIGSLTGVLKATAGTIAATLVDLTSDVTGILGIAHGGTGTSTVPTYGKLLVGNNSGGYDLVATSSLGVADGNFSTTSADFYAHASSTIVKTYTANVFSALQTFGNASSTAFSGLDWLAVGRTATTTIRGEANATSTFAGGIEGTSLNLTGATATSTAANGIDLANGCFSINGECIGSPGGGENSGTLVNIQVFATPGTFTYTPSPGAVSAQVIVTGGGGGGGGAAGVAADTASEVAAGGGGAGGTSIAFVDLTGTTSVQVEVGAGGTAGGNTGTDGGIGGYSAFSTFASATGGSAGDGLASGNAGIAGNEVSGGIGSGGALNIVGGTGLAGAPGTEGTLGGAGGASYWGGGGSGGWSGSTALSDPGSDGVVYGSGGGGGSQSDDSATPWAAGGVGAGGVVVVYEYGPFQGSMSVANGGTGTTTAPTYGQILVGDGVGGYDLLATTSLGLLTASDMNEYMHASTTVAKTYAANIFTALQTFTNVSATDISSEYASSTQGFFGSLSVGSLSGIIKATAGSIASALVDLGSDITGTLSSSNGGTGQSNYTIGDILYADSLGNLTKLAAGTAGQVLKMSGGGLPVWGLDMTGSGGSGGGDSVWATSTNDMFIYPQDPTDVVVIGNSATSTTGYVLEVDGSTLFDRGTLTVKASTNHVGIGTTTPEATLTVDGTTFLQDATTTALAITSRTDALLSTNSDGSIVSTTIDPTLTFSGNALALNLSNTNVWTGLQQFGNATSSMFESMSLFTSAVQSTSTNPLTFSTALTSTAGLTLGSTSTPQMVGLDTLNTRVTLGTGTGDPVVFVLDTKNTEGDPNGASGAMYYNSFTSDFRCYSGAVWRTCGGIAASSTGDVQFKNTDGSFTATSNFNWNLANNGLTIRGNSGQTGDLFTIASSTGSSLFAVSSDGVLKLATTTDPTATTGQLKIYAKDYAGRLMPKWIGPSGVDTPFQSSIGFSNISAISPGSGTTATTYVNAFGAPQFSASIGTGGTFTVVTPTAGSLLSQTRRFQLGSAAATANTGAYIKHGSAAGTNPQQVWRGNAPGLGGFFFVARFGTGALSTTAYNYIGLYTTPTTAPTSVNPTTSTTYGKIGVGTASNTGNWQIIHNVAGTAPTLIDLGPNFPINTTGFYEIILYAAPNDTGVSYRAKNLTTNVEVTGTITTNIPTSTTFMGAVAWTTNGGTAAANNLQLSRIYLETDF